MSAAGRVVAQAKLNLFLEVGAREASGFHQLHTLFARVDLGDAVAVRAGDDAATREVRCRGADAGPPDRNLAFVAAERYASAAGWPLGFTIEIEKRIPVGGGLGGGSADAAAVLRILNALNPHPLAERALLGLAGTIGSDVPFLTSPDVLALGSGRGEWLVPLPPLPPRDVVLLIPPFSVSTAEAYGWLAEERRGDAAARAPAYPAARRMPVAQLGSWEDVAGLAWNDFEPVVERQHPRLTLLRAALDAAGATIARLSGSGSTVFGVFAAAPDVEALASASGGPAFLTRTSSHVVPVERTE